MDLTLLYILVVQYEPPKQIHAIFMFIAVNYKCNTLISQ